MKKIIVIPVVLLLAGAVVAPKIVGGKVDAKLHQMVAHLDSMPGYKASLNEFESSWFSTSATINIGLDMSAMGLADADQQSATAYLDDMKVDIKFNAAHGPLLFGSHSGLGWLGWTASLQGETLRESIKWTQDSPFYHITSTMNLLGNHSFSDQIPSFTTEKGDDLQLAFSGYQGQGTYQGNHLSHRAQIDQFKADVPQGSFESNNISFITDTKASLEEIIAGGIYDSDAKVTIEKISFNGVEPSQEFNLNQLFFSVISTLDQSKEQGNIALSYGAKSFESKEFSASDMALNFEINNLNSATLIKWQQHLRNMSKVDPQSMHQNMMEFFNNNLLSVLAIEPQINVTSLRATIKEGSFDANIHTSLVGIDALPAQMEDIAFWVSHALVNGNIDGDKAAIERIVNAVLLAQMASNPQAQEMSAEELDAMVSQQSLGMLQMLQDQGMVSATETHYSSVFKLKDSKFTINDTAIPLPIPAS